MPSGTKFYNGLHLNNNRFVLCLDVGKSSKHYQRLLWSDFRTHGFVYLSEGLIMLLNYGMRPLLTLLVPPNLT